MPGQLLNVPERAYGPEMQQQAAKFFDQQFQDMTAGGQDVGRATSRGLPTADTPAEGAQAVQSEVADRAARARQLQAQIDQRAQAEAEAQRGIQQDQARAISDAIRGSALPVDSAREAGELVGQNVRDAATANRTEFQNLYREFGNLPGEFRVDAVRGLGTRIRNDLSFRDEPVVVDDQLTPSASRAIQALDEMSQPNIQNRASAFGQPNPDEIAGVNLRGIDQSVDDQRHPLWIADFFERLRDVEALDKLHGLRSEATGRQSGPVAFRKHAGRA
jgi:hypothetical protein